MASQKVHRVAVVGCGALAQAAHLPSAKKNPRIQLAAVCDMDANTADFCKKEFGAERSETDWRKIVDADDIDVCILATHTNLRGDFIVPALEKGKAVYTEKPLAPSRADMHRIIDAVRKTKRPVCVGHNRRSSPAMLEFKRLVDKAKLTEGSAPSVSRRGDRELIPEEHALELLIRVNDDSRSWKPWVFRDEEGIMHAEMVHFMDIALWMNSSRPMRVYAEGSPRGNFTILVRFQDGSLTTMQHTMVGNFDYPKELFEASKNFITVAMEQHIEVRQIGLPGERVQTFFPYAEGSEWGGEGIAGYYRASAEEQKRADGGARRWLNVIKGHYDHLDRFLTHVEGRGENPCDVESAVAVNQMILKVLDSARLGLPVSIGPQDWHIP